MQSWEQLFTKVTDDPLGQIRDAAGKWTNIFAALVGVSTVFGLIQGRDTISKLRPDLQIAFVIVFFLALFMAVVAVFLAALASEGTPGTIVHEKEIFTLWYRQATRRAVRYFVLSRFLALVAVAFLTIALCISWFGPQGSGTGITVLAMQKSGVLVCGTLVEDKAGNLSLIRAGLPPVGLKNIVSINIVSSCP